MTKVQDGDRLRSRLAAPRQACFTQRDRLDARPSGPRRGARSRCALPGLCHCKHLEIVILLAASRSTLDAISQADCNLDGITFEAFPVEHSLRAPAVGYRISTGRTRLFYVPDVVAIRNRRRALQDVSLYV